MVAFISNVDTAFEVINLVNSDLLYKSVLTRICGERRVAITHRNLKNWDDFKTLENACTEKCTLDLHTTQLFGARQSKSESITAWIEGVRRLSSKFRERTLQDCENDESVGIVALADIMRNIRFCARDFNG